MRKQTVSPKINKTVRESKEIKTSERTLFVDYVADVSITNDFEVLEVTPTYILSFDENGDETLATDTEMGYIVREITRHAEVVTLENISRDDFISEEEEN